MGKNWRWYLWMIPFKVQKYVERFGFFTKKGPDITREQIGTVRTNCTDCLDRTNCVQTFLGLEVLQYSLMDLGKFIYPKYYIYINVSYVIEFLTWWVLKSMVFAQKSTVVKWNCCILWIDIEWGLQNLGIILESKVVQKLSLEKMFLTKNFLLNWYS